MKDSLHNNYIMSNNGPRILSCGISDLTCNKVNFWLFMAAYCSLLKLLFR